MIIRKECLGLKFKKKSPFNAEVFNVTITDEPENFALYKVLELDVFEHNIPPIAEVVETDSITVVKSDISNVYEAVVLAEEKLKKKKKKVDGIN